MNVFLITFFVFILVMLGMSLGVILSNREIKGSCGGLNDIDGLSGACDICEGKKLCKKRREMERRAQSQGVGQQH
ncbi:MAG: (Na+)-NQR maturation NqrM [Gammaproteobacteria bacterium]|nr:(Na+)-NQR maturation NqrM [Gammaproteobacteria bacterium]